MISSSATHNSIAAVSALRFRSHVLRGASALALTGAALIGAQPAAAQGVPNLVSACSGVSLPPSVVTNILGPVVTGVVSPIQDTINPLLGILSPLDIDVATLLANAAAGQPINLQVLNANGTVVGPADRCDLQADSVQLETQGGIAIGGNRITGLGTDGLDAVAGEPGSIAFGNSATTSAGAINAVAIGNGASATAANSVALGAGSIAARGASANYAAVGLVGTQNSAGEVSVGAPGAARQITNVAPGIAANDAATVGQVAGVAASVAALGDAAVQYDGADRTLVTLGGVGGTTITNVAAGGVDAASTDAVNGAQLFATNQQVAANTTAIINLGDNIANGGVGPVQYADPAAPTTPNGGVPTNDLTLVGAAAAPVGLHNVAAGAIAAGSTDAVNGAQVFALGQAAINPVLYNADANGQRTNTVTLTGGNAAAAVTVSNVAAGALTAASSDAVNGAQLFATNQNVATVQTTANTALTLSRNSVQYDAGGGAVTLNPGGTSVVLHNVAAGTSATDAANVGQLATGLSGAISTANAYTDARISGLNFDLRRARRAGAAGSSSALAAAGLPQAYEAGKGMIAIAAGAYGGQSALAIGLSKAFDDAHTVVRFSGSYDSRGKAGASGGIGYQF